MLSLEEARARVLARIDPLPSEMVPLSNAVGRIVAESPEALVDLPGFDNSAMDGYAVRSADVAVAAADSPVALRVVSRIAAGESAAGLVLSAGACSRVFTGSMLPEG